MEPPLKIPFSEVEILTESPLEMYFQGRLNARLITIGGIVAVAQTAPENLFYPRSKDVFYSSVL
jgi:hypothetical protein